MYKSITIFFKKEVLDKEFNPLMIPDVTTMDKFKKASDDYDHIYYLIKNKEMKVEVKCSDIVFICYEKQEK